MSQPIIYSSGTNRAQNQSIQTKPSVTAIDNFLRDFYELELKEDWLKTCVSMLNEVTTGFGNLDVSEQSKYIFQQFLLSDMKFSGGVRLLPDDLRNSVDTVLPGPYTLQVNDIVKICSRPQGHMLYMTDGVQSIFGLESKPIQALVSSPAGFKVIIRGVNVVNGILALVPEGFEVLGGKVEYLEAKREKSETEAVGNIALRIKRMQVEAMAASQTSLAVPSSSILFTSSIQGTPSAPFGTNTFRVAADEINMLGATKAMSEMDITEQFAISP